MQSSKLFLNNTSISAYVCLGVARIFAVGFTQRHSSFIFVFGSEVGPGEGLSPLHKKCWVLYTITAWSKAHKLRKIPWYSSSGGAAGAPLCLYTCVFHTSCTSMEIIRHHLCNLAYNIMWLLALPLMMLTKKVLFSLVSVHVCLSVHTQTKKQLIRNSELPTLRTAGFPVSVTFGAIEI